MTGMPGQPGTGAAPLTGSGGWAALAARAQVLRDQVRTQAAGHSRDDLVAMLDSLPAMSTGDPVRVIVAGSLKRGKSTLVNTLVGRPLLSPVGVDITTACWVEIGYGEDQATALIANAGEPGEPTRRPIGLAEVERYAALDCMAEPVLGVEVRVRSPLLEDLVLVDTPGVGGLDTGHSQITLAALGQADALLFVCDCTQPILAAEAAFLASAAQRVATVIVAVTKSDIPGCEVVVRETCQRIAQHDDLAAVPVFSVSPPLADQAQQVAETNEKLAGRLAELAGVAPLVAALRQRTSAGRQALRIANWARTTASAAEALIRRLEEQAADPLGVHGRDERLEAEEARLAAVLADQSLLSVLVAEHMLRLRTDPQDSFASSASALRDQYENEAQRGPAAQLPTLAARMTADLTAAGVTALELAATQSGELVHEILDRAGAAELAADVPASPAPGLQLNLPTPKQDGTAGARGLAIAGQLFPTLVKLIAGSAMAVSVLTGPGAVAASLAVAACAGWWRARGGGEQERRAQLRDWVDSAAGQASTAFSTELTRRVATVQQYLDTVLPTLLAARRADLERVRNELARIQQASAEAQRLAYAQLVGDRNLLQALASEALGITRIATTADTEGT